MCPHCDIIKQSACVIVFFLLNTKPWCLVVEILPKLLGNMRISPGLGAGDGADGDGNTHADAGDGTWTVVQRKRGKGNVTGRGVRG